MGKESSKKPDTSSAREGTVHGNDKQLPLSSLQRALDYGYAQTEERSIVDYLSVLLRHWLVVVTLAGVGLGLAFHYNHNAPRIFQSSALVNIGTYVPPVEGPTGEQLREETRRSNYISTQARLLKSYTIAERVLLQFPDIRAQLDPAFKADPKNPSADVPGSVLQSYLGHVSFKALQGTTLVQVFASSTDPRLSANIANAHVKAFISLVQEQRKEGANKNISFLQAKVAEANAKVEELETRRIAYIEKNNLNIIGSTMSDEIFAQKYKGLLDSLNTSNLGRNNAETVYRALQNSRGIDNSIVQERLTIERLKAELQQATRQYSNRLHPVIIDLQNKIKASERALQKVSKEKINMAREQFNAASMQENRLLEEFEQLNNEQLQQSKHRVTHDALLQEVASAREVQKSIAKRLEEAMINAESTQETVMLVDQAYPSAFPVSPNVSSNLWKGAFLGLLAGLIVAFLLDFVDNKVHSIHDLQQAMHVPVLGVVPQFSKEVIRLSSTYKSRISVPDEDTFNSMVADMTFNHTNPVPLVSAPFSVESEAVRSILATLTAPTGTRSARTLLITSGQKGDGKTTIALNLATALAQVGERTLLIDADLRLPSVHKYFELSRHARGLLECLTENEDPSQTLLPTSVENLTLMMPGGPCTNPASLLKSDSMGQLLQMLAQEFDFIIIDSPPVGAVADSLLLARHVDGVAVVVRSGETSRGLAESAVVRLRQVGARILGVVLNDATRGESYWRAGYNSKYGTNYSYTQDV